MNEARFIETQRLAFAMFCDESDLTVSEGSELAARLGDELADTAEYRASYVGTAE